MFLFFFRDLRLSHWISHKYLLLTLSLIDSSWNCLTQIMSKLSSVVSRSSASVYQVSLWLVAPKTFQTKLDSVRIFLSKDSCVAEVVQNCMLIFNCMSMQECVAKRRCKFLANYVTSDNILCYVCQNTAAHELNMLGKRWLFHFLVLCS